MGLLEVLIVLAIIGILLWVVPMDDRIKKVIVALVAIAAALWLLNWLGVVNLPFNWEKIR